MSISFQPQTKPSGEERKCTERAGTQLCSSPPLEGGGPIPGKPCLLSSLISPRKRLCLLPLCTTQAFPLLSQLSIDSIFISI